MNIRDSNSDRRVTPEGSDPSSDRGVSVAIAVLSVVAVLVASDLLLDDQAGAEPGHLVIEALLMFVSAAGAIWLWWGRRRARAEVRLLVRDIDTARAEAERWRSEASELMEGLGVSIARQFKRWKLTEAESMVALLLLKGLSHREAASVRGVSERTVRQQAREVYRKANLSGRSELSAFFLEDLLLPPDQR